MTALESLFQGSYSHRVAKDSGFCYRPVFNVGLQKLPWSNCVESSTLPRFAEFCNSCLIACEDAEKSGYPAPQVVFYSTYPNSDTFDGKYTVKPFADWDGFIPENVGRIEMI